MSLGSVNRELGCQRIARLIVHPGAIYGGCGSHGRTVCFASCQGHEHRSVSVRPEGARFVQEVAESETVALLSGESVASVYFGR